MNQIKYYTLLGAIISSFLAQDLIAADLNQTKEEFSAKVVKTYSYNYLKYLPNDYDGKTKFPLLLFLHGAGERGDNLEKVAVHERIALILQYELGREVGPDVNRVIKTEPMPVVAVGEVGAAGEAAGAGGGIAVVEQVNRRLAAAGLAKVVARVEADSPAPARAVVEVRLAAELIAQVPVIRALEKEAEAAAVTGREAPLVRRPIEPVAIVRKIKHRDFSCVKRCATGLDVFAGDDAQVAGAEAQHRIGAVVGGQPNVVGRVAVTRGVALDVGALNEKRRLPRAKIVGLHCAGLEVVKQAVGGDDALLVL